MKGHMANVSKCIFAIVLVFIPTLVLAQGEIVPPSPLWDMFYNLTFTPPADDMSVAVLAKMFGVVPGVPQFSAAGTTVIGVIFSVFNAGVLAISGIFLSYTITRVVTETTMDGAAIGKNTTIWTAVRCALSTSLLVPQPSGYSLVNGIVMWVVIQGIGLADLTWSKALDYLEEGGTAVAAPTPQINYSLINWDVHRVDASPEPQPLPNKVGSADVLRSLTCAHIVRDALVSRQTETYNYLLGEQGTRDLTGAEMQEFVNASTPIPEMGDDFAIYKDFESAKSYSFPNITGETKTKTPLNDYGLGMSNIPKNLSGICGTINYGVNQSVENYDEYVSSKKNGLDSMISILEPVAKQLIEKIKIGNNGERELDPATYDVYTDKDNIKHKFIYDSALLFLPGTSLLNPSIKDLTSFMLDKAGLTPGSKLAQYNISYPFGTEGILAAAAEYQYAVADARKTGKANLSSYSKKRFAEARKDGWIGAGAYYRLLTKVQKAVTLEYQNYRLTGYEAPNTPFSDVSGNPNSVRDPNASSTLMRATKYGYGISGVNPIATVNQEYKILLDKTMAWIYYTYPYAQIYSKVFAANIAKLESEEILPPINIPILVSIKGFLLTAKIITYMLAGIGTVMVTLFPPVGLFMLAPIPLAFLAEDVAAVVVTWADVMGPDPIMGFKDPIMKLQALGESMIANSLLYVTEVMVLTAAVLIAITTASLTYQTVGAAASLSLFANAVSQFINLSITQLQVVTSAMQTIVFISIPFGLAVFIPMFVSGVMFSVYVPLIPYMLYLFGVISWLISVLVLMAAAPIICFLMLWGNSSQENPLLAREAEQFLMQIIGAFFRPTLMVIGLVAGVVLSYIAVDLLNLSFYSMAIDVLLNANWSAPVSALVAMVVKAVGMVVIYTTIMVTLVNMCFSPIYLLYQEAMRVIGISAPAVGMEAQQLEAVKGAFVQAVSEVGAGIKGTAEGFVQRGGYAQFQPEKKGAGGESGAEGEEGGEEGGGGSAEGGSEVAAA